MARRPRISLKWWIALIIACLAIEGGLLVHRLVSRPDRVKAAARYADLVTVRDAVLRYEFEHGVAPPSLDALVPRYLRKDQVRDAAGKSLYVYDPRARILREKEGPLIRGLFTYRMSSREVSLYAPGAAGHGGIVHAAAHCRGSPRGLPDLFSPWTGAFIPAAADTAGFRTPGPGMLVFEAELFCEMNYGWEIKPDDTAGGGAYLYCKEGITNGPAQEDYKLGNFYDVHATSAYTYVRYRFRVPAAGTYYVYGRMWTTDTHCSNNICVAVDKGGPQVGSMDNRTPFRWIWTPMGGNPVRLAAGDHFLHLFIHEDGIRLDQFVVSPRPMDRRDDAPFIANYVPGTGTAWEKDIREVLYLSFHTESQVLARDVPFECGLFVRRLKKVKGRGTIRVSFSGGGEEKEVFRCAVDFGVLPVLTCIPVRLRGIRVEDLKRKEYILRAAALDADGKVLARAHVVLVRPYAWEVSRMLHFIPNEADGPFDPGKEGKEDPGWRPLASSCFTCFGVLDFGLHTSGNWRHAPRLRTIYARTRIRVPAEGTYLMKIQSDDQMRLWIDGKEAARIDTRRPVTRNGRKVRVFLKKGTHTVLIRVNQYDRPWQAYVVFRTADDGICGITGAAPVFSALSADGTRGRGTGDTAGEGKDTPPGRR